MFIFIDGRNQKENVPLRLLFILNGNLRAIRRVALARRGRPSCSYSRILAGPPAISNHVRYI